MPIGRYDDIIMESACKGGLRGEGVFVAVERDLVSLEPLLAPGLAHRARLEGGDVCLWTGTAGKPVGLVWLNRVGHQDEYLGKLSNPTVDGTGYVNQLIVSPDRRGEGVGVRLLRGLMAHAAQLGTTRVRAFVSSSNSASIATFRAAGFEEAGRQWGLRVGRRLTLRCTTLASAIGNAGSGAEGTAR